MTLHLDLQVAAELAVAALAGLAVGIERERSGHATGPEARFAGARTFLLLGLLGGLAGWLLAGDMIAAGVLLLASGSALTVAAYVTAARRGGEGIDGTTEVAALVVLAVGAASGLGFPLLTSAVTAVMVLILIEKPRIHSAISRIGDTELAAALQFAVLALVILPILPNGPYGPFDSIRPRSLWVMVLLFSGLNFAGYLARRAVGVTHGYSLAGMLGGLVSSTAVTFHFSRQSRDEPAAGRALALGVVGACTVLVVRVLLVGAALRPAVALALVPYLAPVLAVGAAVFALAYLRRDEEEKRGEAPQDRSPLGLWAAIKMAIAFQAVLILIPLVQQAWGSSGLLASAALIGLTDLDALTLSMTRLEGADAVALGARGIAVGVLANSALKLGLTLVLGSAPFRRLASSGLAAMGAASALALWLVS
ncbi:MAG TPA: MgtC/SapB family protein [Gemmatimonadales bacterium]|jgi:uncharacterized membrane protein (DUF4010 family)